MSNEENEQQPSRDDETKTSDAETAFEEYAGDKECPECGEPVIDVRANCPNCGYEYKESDYTDQEAGSEFVSGTAVDEEGNENPDDATGKGEDDAPDGSEDE